MDKIKLPNFLIIGSAKSATTWLVRQLESHPDIYIYFKEIFYFCKNYSKGLKWYEGHFRAIKDQHVIGENSNGYLPHPDAPGRIKKLLPDIKLIASLRNPAERAYSAYCMHFEKGSISDNIEAYLDPKRVNGKKWNFILLNGLYAKQLKRYFSYFDKSQIKILIYDDLKQKPQSYLKTVCDFLGVEYRKLSTDFYHPENPRPPKVYPMFLKLIHSYFERTRMVSRVLKKITAKGLSRKIKEKLRTRQISYPLLTDDLKNKLLEYYKSDIKELEGLIERDLSHWYQ